MKRDMLPPLAVLVVILAFALWNSAAITNHTQRWRDQLQQVEELAAKPLDELKDMYNHRDIEK